MSRIYDLEKRVKELEDKFEYPISELGNSHFEDWVKDQCFYKWNDYYQLLYSKMNKLAELSGYEWKEGGTWQKKK